mgnify:CR=1 FL=1
MQEDKIKEIESKNQDAEKHFQKERDEWGEKIKNLVYMIRDVNELTEVSVLMLSYRHIIIDTIANLQQTLYRQKSTYENFFKNKYVEYTTNYDVKLNGGEKEKFIRSDLAFLQRRLDLIENQIDFFRECIRTLDNLGFSIRNRYRSIE